MSAPDTSMPTMGEQMVTNAINPPEVSTSDVPNQIPTPDPTQALQGAQSQTPEQFANANPPQGQGGQQPDQQPAKPSLWRNILSGALQGLAASGSVNTRGMSGAGAFAAGLGAGANQVLNVVPQQKAALDSAAVQNAFHHVQLAQIQREMALAPQDKHEQYLDNAATTYNEMLKSGAAVPMNQPTDFASAQKTYQQLTLKNPAMTYSIMPTGRGDDGEFQYSAVQYPNSPTQADVDLTDPDGQTLTVPAGTPANKIGQVYTSMVSKTLDRDSKEKIAGQNNATKVQTNAATNATKVQTAGINAAARATAAAGQNVVAFDPDYQNTDGSKGGNVVLDKGTAQQRGLFNYKIDPSVVNANVAGFNDVQNKLNQLASVVNDPKRMSQVQPELAAAILAHGKGIEVGAFGTKMDLSRVNEALYKEDVAAANQATRDFVTAYVASHEAITQLPRLQTFGKSSRMTQQQMEAAQNMLPQPGDGPALGAQKMQSLQTTIDPLRKQLPHMQGAELIPSWLEQQQKPPAATHVFDPNSGILNALEGGR